MAQPLILDPPLPTRLIHQLSGSPWIENIAVRFNGQLLLTVLSKPELYLLDPSKPSAPVLVHTFDDVHGLTGIIEVEHDVFYLTGGTFDLSTFSNVAGSYSLYEVNLTSFDQQSKAMVKKITHLPEMGLPNGLELLSRPHGAILIADSEVGAAWKVDVKSGKYEIAVQFDEMKIPASANFPIGVNGLQIRNEHLYWTNTAQRLFCRVKIDSDGKAMADVEILERETLVDDFVFDKNGNAWLAQNPLNTVGVAKASGGVLTVAGRMDQTALASATACQFGKKKDDQDLLYVVTGTGNVVVVDTSRFASE